MHESTEQKKAGWCSCCDGKDEKCRCICHQARLRFLFKALLTLIILGIVFGAGVFVGKFSSYGHFYRKERGNMFYQYQGNTMMRPQMMNRRLPMMNNKTPDADVDQNSSSSPSWQPPTSPVPETQQP